jgi:hypothetical protein
MPACAWTARCQRRRAGWSRCTTRRKAHKDIKKGRIGKPVELGYLAQVVDVDDGIVVDHSVYLGNPADGPLLAPAV